MIITILIILIVLAVVGAPNVGVLPTTYGWYPSGGLGLVLVVVLILLVLGRLG